MKKDVVFYETKVGKVPLQRWLSKLRDHKAAARIQKRIRNMQLGKYGDYKYLRDGVFELRINEGGGYRVYFAERNNKYVVLLLNGGIKRTQAQDIEKAIEYLHEYEKRYSNE